MLVSDRPTTRRRVMALRQNPFSGTALLERALQSYQLHPFLASEVLSVRAISKALTLTVDEFVAKQEPRSVQIQPTQAILPQSSADLPCSGVFANGAAGLSCTAMLLQLTQLIPASH
jgi:hypothetical protein